MLPGVPRQGIHTAVALCRTDCLTRIGLDRCSHAARYSAYLLQSCSRPCASSGRLEVLSPRVVVGTSHDPPMSTPAASPGPCLSFSLRDAQQKASSTLDFFLRFLCSPGPEDSCATLGLPSTRWASYRGTNDRHAPALPLRCRHGRSNAGAQHRLQGRDAPGVAQATGACSPCHTGRDSSRVP